MSASVTPASLGGVFCAQTIEHLSVRDVPRFGRPGATVTSAATAPITSGHGGEGLPTHVPATHASSVVQTSPSLQESETGACTQPVRESHVSSVHTL